jgi:macrolide-specific efflux system membrane fusion protein
MSTLEVQDDVGSLAEADVRRRLSWLHPTKLKVFISILILVGAGAGSWAMTRPSTPTTTTTLVAASLGTVRSTIASSGTIEPAKQETLNFAAAGTVSSVRVAVGQHVKAGQVLATIDSASLKASVAQAEASVASMRARLASDEDADASSAQIAADKASVNAAVNQLDSAKASLADATLRSPITGAIASVNLTAGQQVSGTGGGSSTASGSNSSASTASSAQLVVISDSSWIVNASVDDTQVGQLKKGLQAVVTPAGSSTQVFGLVSSVALLANSSSGVASYPIVIDITGSPSGLYAGASANITIIVKQLSNVLLVQTAALHFDAQGTYVYVVQNGARSLRRVTTGMSAGAQTQITRGLSNGEQVQVVSQRRTTTTGGNGGGGRGGFGGGFGGGLGGPPGGFGGGR